MEPDYKMLYYLLLDTLAAAHSEPNAVPEVKALYRKAILRHQHDVPAQLPSVGEP